MSKKIRTTLIIVLVTIILAALAVFLIYSQRITMNPDGTVGNTAGNLNNSGLFCEYNGTVYFCNTTDGGSLFSMNPDESNPRQLSTLKVRNILAGGDYLYYFQTGAATPQSSGFGQLQGVHSFDRCKLDGSNVTTMTRDVVVNGQLVNNYLYLLTTSNSGISFYSLKIDNSDRQDIADYAINPSCAENGIIYYSGTQTNHYLYSLNTATGASSEYWRGNLWNPVKEGDYIYYMDVENNYRLCRYSRSQDVIQVLTNDRVDCFNVGSGYVYYQKNSTTTPQLICMRSDGSDSWPVADGIYTNINMTSRYVYFQAYGDDTTMYHAPLGSGSYSEFRPTE